MQVDNENTEFETLLQSAYAIFFVEQKPLYTQVEAIEKFKSAMRFLSEKQLSVLLKKASFCNDYRVYKSKQMPKIRISSILQRKYKIKKQNYKAYCLICDEAK